MVEPFAATGEFALIARYLQRVGAARSDVVLGVGDDAALLHPPADQQLVVAMDALVSGVHYPAETAAAAVGHKALAVNLSDLAAMAATPAWATLTLALPQADMAWVADFVRGFEALAQQHQVALVGGDTVRSTVPMVVVQLQGSVPPGQALRRSGAAVGDTIWVSGTLGDAGAALALWQVPSHTPPALTTADRHWLRQRLDCPTPQVALGVALRGLATAAIDISDGLVADLGHLLRASAVGATLQLAALPLSPALRRYGSDPVALALYSGDDYELCFTAPPTATAAIQQAAHAAGCGVTPIGVIESTAGLRLQSVSGVQHTPSTTAPGFDHFADRASR